MEGGEPEPPLRGGRKETLEASEGWCLPPALGSSTNHTAQRPMTLVELRRSMPSVKSTLDTVSLRIGQPVTVRGMLLGMGFHRQYIADSVEGLDRGVALELVEDDLFTRIFDSGVSPVGGGRFTFRLKAEVSGTLSELGDRAYALTKLTQLTVEYRDREIRVIRTC